MRELLCGQLMQEHKNKERPEFRMLSTCFMADLEYFGSRFTWLFNDSIDAKIISASGIVIAQMAIVKLC